MLTRTALKAIQVARETQAFRLLSYKSGFTRISQYNDINQFIAFVKTVQL